jgi:hypothetical protein
MSNEPAGFVWVFTGPQARFASGVFLNKEAASKWISQHKLTGILTKYPVNEGVYDWAVKNNHFAPKREDQTVPDIIARFTCASLEHYHCENGKLVAGS